MTRGVKSSHGHSKVSKLGLWWDPFIQSRECMSLKFTDKLYVLTLKKNTKFERELTYRFKIDMKNLTNFNPSTWKFQKFQLLTGSFWPKYIMLELEKYRGVMFVGIEDCCDIWMKTGMCFQNWHEEFGKLWKIAQK